ncbi:TonB-dependent receptor [soil metagenome]
MSVRKLPPIIRICCILGLLGIGHVRAQEAVSEAVVVRADRLPEAEASRPFSLEVVTEQTLRAAPQARLDDVLRAQVAGFSLFRRSSSRVANPTTQGVTLRNFGPSGAGRTLVLLDGIPMNDPFAGYVQWNQVPPSSLDQVLVTPGGGAGLFGNAALAGTIYLRTRSAEEDAASAQVQLGNGETYGGSIAGTLVRNPVTFSLFAEAFSTGGYPVLRAKQRGPVDRNATADSAVLQLGSGFQLGPETSLQLQLRRFHEERGNGTIFTRNETDGTDASAVLTTRFPQLAGELRLTGYGQQRKYRSTFSSVNAARNIETPALDQFHVPANAAGGSAVWAMPLGAEHAITLGADTRWVEGETNELFRFVGNNFANLRSAGGQQLFVGLFAEDKWTPSPVLDIVGSLRADFWQLSEGFRRERDRATGLETLSSTFQDRSGFSVNGRLGTSVNVHRDIALRGAFYSGFRVPTLNELYRPFRVGNAITAANAELEPERLLGGEAGLEWQATPGLRIVATGFYNRLEDAIGNVTIGFGPGTFDPGGFVPAGGVLRQRQNIELVTAPGAELSLSWQVVEPVRLRASYLFTRPIIARAAEQNLEGKLLAQTPEHVLTGGIEWRPAAKWLLVVQGRSSGRQFEDDQNSAELAAFAVVDAAVSYEFNDRVSGGLKIENLFNTEIETGRSPDGLVSIGAPRLVTLELRCRL